MIDIHSHILPEVDDGSPSLDVSMEMLRQEESAGVDTVILTPHYQNSVFTANSIKIREEFEKLVGEAKREGIKINLKLGQEIFVDDGVYDKLQNGELLTLNGTKCVLLEFHYTLNSDIADTAYNFKALGYKPIIAHIERYSYVHKTDAVLEIRENGGLIQVNASSVTGDSGKHAQKFVMSLIKNGLVDFIAADYHSERGFHLKEAYEVVVKKFGVDVAEKLFVRNAEKILDL